MPLGVPVSQKHAMITAMRSGSTAWPDLRRCALALLATLSCAASAQDAARGRLLYETHCGGCHYERLHDRPRERSIVKSRTQLYAQVAQRATLVKQAFTREELDEITEYLDRSHYHFTRNRRD